MPPVFKNAEGIIVCPVHSERKLAQAPAPSKQDGRPKPNGIVRFTDYVGDEKEALTAFYVGDEKAARTAFHVGDEKEALTAFYVGDGEKQERTAWMARSTSRSPIPR